MSASKIEWTDETWNPTLGCTRVSPGCENCYAIRQSRMRASNPNAKVAAAHVGLTHRDATGRIDWTNRVNLLPERLVQPLRWRRPRRVFVDSLTDLFHDEVPREFIARVFAVMSAGHHTYQLLTKRHGRMRTLLSDPTFVEEVGRVRRCAEWTITTGGDVQWPLPNLHLGVSVEDQQRAALRIPALLETPAAVRWISAEPLLGALDLQRVAAPRGAFLDVLAGDVMSTDGTIYAACPSALDWVVVGGESGPGARPMHPQWARGLRDQCASAGVSFHFKQWGDWLPTWQKDPRYTGPVKGGYWKIDGSGWAGFTLPVPEAPAWVLRLGKTASGRELDGRTHDEYPPAVPA